MNGKDPVTGRPGEYMVVSRAATAIFLILSQTDLVGKQVIVPANLCYAGIYPVLYAGLEPVFCDVDPISGNITCESVSAALTAQTGAMIIPHMYGNPVLEMRSISELCHERGILLIEDCASAMGAQAADYCPGTMGDYVVYSTGYSKTIDLGYGGLLVSHIGPVSVLEKRERELLIADDETEQNMAFFSKLYRLLRNEGGDLPLARMIYTGMPSCCKSGFINALEEERKKDLLEALMGLSEVIDRRRRALREYEDVLGETMGGMLYPYEDGAVPWRLNLIIQDTTLRRRLIQDCLSKHLPVSDWYPMTTPMFGVRGGFPGAAWHEEHILNFPLLIDEEVRQAICNALLRNVRAQ